MSKVHNPSDAKKNLAAAKSGKTKNSKAKILTSTEIDELLIKANSEKSALSESELTKIREAAGNQDSRVSNIDQFFKDEKTLWQIEKITDHLQNLAIMAAMEAGRMGDSTLVEFAGSAKFVIGIINHLIENKRFGDGKMTILTGEVVVDENNQAQKLNEKRVSDFSENITSVLSGLELNVLNAFLAGNRTGSKAFQVCNEEIRLEVQKLFKIVNPAAKQKHWDSRYRIETGEGQFQNSKAEILSFDLGGVEIIEDLSLIKQIDNYNRKIIKVKNGKLETSDRLAADYIDLYQLSGLPKPQDTCGMKIIVIERIIRNKFNPECIKKLYAFPVDKINYPFSTLIGKTCEYTANKIDPNLVSVCWNSQFGDLWDPEAENLQNIQLPFLDWEKISQNSKKTM